MMEEIKKTPDTENEYLLEVKNLVKWFPIKSSFFKQTIGNVRAVDGISFKIKRGQTMGLVGESGCGKSTAGRTILRLLEKTSGEVWFDGKEITNLDTKNMVQSGIILSPEGRQVFPRFSVMDNLMMGAYLRPKTEIAESLQTVYDLLPKLKVRSGQLAGSLSGGEQQMLAMGRALMSHPKLLMMDEPSMGLSPLLVDQVFEIIKDINNDGTTILLVEQNAGKSLAISDRAYVLETGKIVLSGTGKELMESEEVKKAYLGG